MTRKLIISLMFVVTIAIVAVLGCKKDIPSDAAVTKLVVATDSTWPPMEFVNENKEIVGFDVDLIKAVGKAGGFEVEVKSTAWDGIFAGLEAGEYDAVISSVTINDERKNTMDFSLPYVNAGQVIIVRSDTSGVTTLSDLSGKVVGAQIGTTGAMEIDKIPAITKKSYDELGLAIEELVNSRIDAVVCDTPIAADFALQKAEYKNKLKIVGKAFTEEYYGIAIKKGNKRVLDAVNKGLEIVLKSDEYGKMKEKWLNIK